MKRSSSFLPAVLLLTFCVTPLLWSQNIVEMIDNVDIRSINRMQVEPDGGDYVLNVSVTFENKNNVEIRMQDCAFTVALTDGKTGTPVAPLGSADPLDILLPSGAAGAPATQDVDFKVRLGPMNSAQTVQKSIRAFNLIGNPKVAPLMITAGRAKVGVKAARGWISDVHNEIEFQFRPKIQRDILF